jgi:hypothetical protein
MKIALGVLMSLVSMQVMASLLYCNEGKLKNIATNEVVRIFDYDGDRTKYLDYNCSVTLAASKNGLYCNEGKLKNIATNEVVRIFDYDGDRTKYLDYNCSVTLSSTIKN